MILKHIFNYKQQKIMKLYSVKQIPIIIAKISIILFALIFQTISDYLTDIFFL